MNKCFNQLFLNVKHFNKNESCLLFSVSVGQPRRDARLDQGYLWGHSGPTGSWTLSKTCLCLMTFWVLRCFVLLWFDLSFVKCFVATHPVHVQPNHVSLQMSLIYVYCWNDLKSHLKRTVYPKIKHVSLSAQKLARFTRLPFVPVCLCSLFLPCRCLMNVRYVTDASGQAALKPLYTEVYILQWWMQHVCVENLALCSCLFASSPCLDFRGL